MDKKAMHELMKRVAAERKKPIFEVSKGLGGWSVTVRTKHSSMSWSMGLHFEKRRQAVAFRTIVEDYCRNHPEGISF